jgi:SpoVK/Ycf46/Vps4 family AAA+-type ATPase
MLSASQLDVLSGEYNVPIGVIEKSVTQAKGLGCDKGNFYETVLRVLRAHVTLSMDGAPPLSNSDADDEYTLEGVCVDGSAANLLEKCRRADAMYRESGSLRPGGGTMLFYGPPGTGKTALAKEIAKILGRECHIKRASDLLSPYVGASEQNIAGAFREAEADGAILIIDEADSFLYSREIVVRSWENTLVNEFLTTLETCRGFCICTTNRIENMDAAAMRRFSFKISFSYAGQEQIIALYNKILAPLAKGSMSKSLERELKTMPRLTPGDFHAVESQFWLSDTTEVSHEELVKALKREQGMKLERDGRRVGF